MADEVWAIYVLFDPRDEIPRYVGRTCVGLDHRLRTHIAQRQVPQAAGRPKDAWLCQLVNEGVRPQIREIDRATGWKGNGAERYWIQKLYAEGAPLLNIHHIPRQQQKGTAADIDAMRRRDRTPGPKGART